MTLLKRLLLVICMLGAPLFAQLDPNLQSSKTDFLDLYQQSTSTKARPEIVSVFDFSGSMAALMFHPLYRNDDAADSDAYRNMRFVRGSTTATAPNNRYRIRARDNTCTDAYAYYDVTVTATGVTATPNGNPAGCAPAPSQTYNTAPTYTVRVQADGNTNAYATVTLTPTASGANPSYALTGNANNGTRSNTYGTFTITHASGSTTPAPTIELSPSGPWGQGTTVTLTAYLTHPLPPVTEPPTPNYTGISWSLSNNGNFGAAGNPNTAGSLGSAVWSQVNVGLYKSVQTFVIPAWTPWTYPGTTGNLTQLRPISLISGTLASGNTITLNTYYLTKGTSDQINWTVHAIDTTNQSCVPMGYTTPGSTTGNTTSYQASKSVTWTIPAWQDPATCTTYSGSTGVTVTLEASKSGFDSGGTYVGTLTSTILIKPDGTQVTQADADAASATSGLRGATVSPGSLDVRNWIRAASHVRFAKTISGTVTRTIDIPIPWKITDRASTGNPLTSVTTKDYLDKVTGKDADGNDVHTIYGSNLDVELDRSYRIENANRGTFTSDGYWSSNWNPTGSNLGTGAVTTAYLFSVVYKPSYVSWLFYGKYQNTDAAKPNYTNDSSLVGKYIVFDAANASLVGGQGNVSWGQGYGPSGTWGNMVVPRYNLDGTYRDTTTAEASNYRIPAMTRVQAVKSAAINTWIKHQHEVLWAFRFLDPSGEANGGSATQIDNNCLTTLNASDATTVHVNGNDSGWKVLNNTAAQGLTSTTGNSVTGMNRIASLFANGGTPLTYAMARALAQFNSPNNVFNSVVEAGDVSQCVNQYLLLFTDGMDNNGTGTNNANSSTPYITGSGATAQLDALAGNRAIITTPALVDTIGNHWNLFTFAGIGAHLADPTMGTLGSDYLAALDPGTVPSVASLPSAFLPYAIKGRNGIEFSKPHRVTTMTVGVSLGGQYTDASSPKRSLYLAAVAGDPDTNSGLLSSFHSFNGYDQTLADYDSAGDNDWKPKDEDPTSYPEYGEKRDGAVYFFDATDIDKLSRSLDYALRIAISASSNNVTSSPNLPYVGSAFGKQVYIGKFQTPMAGGVIWPGDLLMFGTRESGGVFSLVDPAGNPTTTVDNSTAQWSAADALKNNRGWKDRKLYTRLPGNSTNPERGIHAFTDIGTAYSNPDGVTNSAGLQHYVATSLGVGSVAQAEVIQNAAGGDIAGTKDVDGRPVGMRLNIMGDVINSSPAAVEYKFSSATIASGISSPSPLATLSDPERFRLILVGTNQGWLHAFGEVTREDTVTDSYGKPQKIIKGQVDELWAFMPTDFLNYLGYAYAGNAGKNAHRFMVDGTPAIYTLDLPPSTGGSADGVVDPSTTSKERAIAIVGLGKGGRSYYAIDIKDPFNPALKWSLVPDEADLFPASRNLVQGMDIAELRAIIKNMGFSTCTPGIGRVAFTQGTTTTIKDVVFIGGGLSLPEIETNFKDVDGNIPLMGRSVLALDVNTGAVLGAISMPSGAGPIASGVVPFEFVVNSGMAQRAYFTDRFGGLWAWGNRKTPALGEGTYDVYNGFREDTSDLAKWTMDGSVGSDPGLRKVHQDGSLQANARITSTLPAPFRVGTFPGKPYNPGVDETTARVIPAAVGVALVTGDRNNPLDYLYTESNPLPTRHRLTVVFDRQDSQLWGFDAANSVGTGIQDTNLIDFTDNTVGPDEPTNRCTEDVWKLITPGCPEYYLRPDSGDPKFGYYVNFPVNNETFVSKGINSPMVVAGSLFYTYFTPTSADPCSGGKGYSYSNLICDVINPIVTDKRDGLACTSGIKYTWVGVASDYIAFGTRGVFQGGTIAVLNPAPGSPTTTPQMTTIQGRRKESFPKPRVWRTVQ